MPAIRNTAAHIAAFARTLGRAFAVADLDGQPLGLAEPEPVIQFDPRTLGLASYRAIDSAFADAYADAYGFTPAERDEFARRLAASDGPGH